MYNDKLHNSNQEHIEKSRSKDDIFFINNYPFFFTIFRTVYHIIQMKIIISVSFNFISILHTE